MDMRFARKKIKYKNHHSLKKGLNITYEWFVKNQIEFKKKKIILMNKFEKNLKLIKADIIKAIYHSKKGHLGGSLSLR